MANRQNKGARSALFGGLSGGVFFFGLAIASVSGHFLPVFFATLALTSLLGSLASLSARGMYGGLQGFVFLMGLAILEISSLKHSSLSPPVSLIFAQNRAILQRNRGSVQAGALPNEVAKPSGTPNREIVTRPPWSWRALRAGRSAHARRV
jgi:hypothetical protein